MSDVTTHNLQHISVRIPVASLTCVTGVSGSGKSSLVIDSLLPAVKQALRGDAATEVRLQGAERFDRVIEVDQSPIGRTPRSSPASFVGAFDDIRELFATLPEARARAYGPARFSFNVKGGRCEVCRGDGLVRVDMQFLPDVFVVCESCGGNRYDRETLDVRYRGYSVADVLRMSVADARELFAPVPKLSAKLAALSDVGLGYLALGQPANTLSGGEAQRIKLARELARKVTGKTLLVLDEPTTGLHFQDVAWLIELLQRLTSAGNTVVVVEHHLDLIRAADYVIDMGPEGGPAGGQVVVVGDARGGRSGATLAHGALPGPGPGLAELTDEGVGDLNRGFADLRAFSDQKCQWVKVHAFHFASKGFHERADTPEQIAQQMDVAFTLCRQRRPTAGVWPESRAIDRAMPSGLEGNRVEVASRTTAPWGSANPTRSRQRPPGIGRAVTRTSARASVVAVTVTPSTRALGARSAATAVSWRYTSRTRAALSTPSTERSDNPRPADLAKPGKYVLESRCALPPRRHAKGSCTVLLAALASQTARGQLCWLGRKAGVAVRRAHLGMC